MGMGLMDKTNCRNQEVIMDSNVGVKSGDDWRKCERSSTLPLMLNELSLIKGNL